MPNIMDLLKRPGVRLSAHDTWIVWDSAQEAWVVYHHKYRARRSTTVIVTSDEEQAVAAFENPESFQASKAEAKSA
jgi:hypothetical protein